MPQQKTYSIEDIIREEATKVGVPPELALAVAEQESGFDPGAIGPEIQAGTAKGQRAVGVFQLVPGTSQMLGVQDPSDPIQNITGGVKYLSNLMEKHQGDTAKVLAEYGGVVHDTAYVPGVTARMAKFTQAGVPATPPVDPIVDLAQGAQKAE